MIDLPIFINNVTNGFSVGIGSALGTYLVTRHFIKRMENLEKKLNGDKK